MSTVSERYESLYRWLKTKGIEEIASSVSDPRLQHEMLQIITTLPHPVVARNRDITRACSRVQKGVFEVLADEEITLGETQEEMIRFEDLAKELEDRASEAIEEPLERKLERIESLLEELDDTTSTTRQRVGKVNESTQEMRAMLSTTRDRVDQTLKSVCPECSGDLRVYPHRGSDNNTELRLGCRDCNHEEYHVTSSSLVDEKETPSVPVHGIGPLNAYWWIAEIRVEGRALRSIIFRYDGQEVVATVFIIVVGLILAGLALRDVSILWSLAGVGLSLLSLLVGPTAWDLTRRLRDPYENRYYEAALTVIDRVGGENKRALKQIAMQHLEKVERSEAEETLEECALELARACR